MEQIRHAGSDAFRAQTEQAAIRIVTPHYKIPEKPGTDVQIGSSLQDLSSKLTDAADYRAERAAEHFRMQIIDPRVASHAHIPAHAIRDYARRHLIDDFPSLHGKRSFLDLEALDQLRIRPKGKLGDATDRDKDLDKFLKNRDGKPWELAYPPKVDDDSLRELDRLRNNIDNLQKVSFYFFLIKIFCLFALLFFFLSKIFGDGNYLFGNFGFLNRYKLIFGIFLTKISKILLCPLYFRRQIVFLSSK
uniref:Uncharacterized protein n=1 Tax=Meloidogyne enterolobii TaxID=390850 RepID=A0A6V7TUB8_MELEN|nr:unnamed protein product [Meloidogyne enterolobii]